MEEVFVYQSSNGGYLNKWDGKTYCHNVYRRFSKHQSHENAERINIKKLFDCCPLPKEKIEEILLSGKVIVNVFEDVYNGKDSEKEWWDFGTLCGFDWEKVEEPAKDGKWYEWNLYKNEMARLDKLLRGHVA